MARKLRTAMALIVLCCASPAAYAESYGVVFRLSVPVQCTVQYSSMGAGGGGGEMVSLGELREFCNAPQGYELVVSYAPGTMEGARLSAGGDQIVLNGSGEAVVSRQTGPRIQARPIFAAPGANGFDTDRLLFQLRPV